MLTPQPGAKPEYIDDIRLVDDSPALLAIWQNNLPSDQITIEAYSKDSWAWKPGSDWATLTVESSTGRNKLPGFCDYLKQRQKSAVARFPPTGIFVISYIQPKSTPDAFRMQCRIAIDMSRIPNCNLKPLTVPKAAIKPPSTSVGRPRQGGGLLAKLVGAQERTNYHFAMASSKKKPDAAPVNAAVEGVSTKSSVTKRTAAEVFSAFRQSMQDKMLDFDLDESEEVLHVQVSLAEHVAGLSDEDKGRVTMEVLKYMVYEAAEEVNDEWIAHKEPSEFMDEVTIAIYKEGAAPDNVLEEVNKGELPDEVRGQQRAIQEERNRQVNKAENRTSQLVEADAHRQLDDEDEEDLAVLNTSKRDRRTIEDYEREKKRSRGS
ncbi:hypothetical protein FisN_25Lh167 [Fistulifera solaris]|uniref:Uncharacterized protein n=1 Tax=Fistulifera solaris TaxID=1519565 RepID=A0A1Z5KRP8_FISSO|nr:hypothetical protein FisN_25Lh167 [Fistulifera solaris]|eukprot:GAX28775.1 hypothetical protein FisN_25Lh167 [Fistulifera solaris]